MKKVLVVINTMGRAGAERVLISLFKTIPADVFEIDFLSIVERGEFFAEIPKNINILNKEYTSDSVLDDAGKKFLMNKIIKSMFKKLYGVRYIPHFIRNLFLQAKRGGFFMDKLFWKALADTAPRFDKEYDLAIAYTEGAATYYVANHVKAKKKVSYVHVDYTVAGYMKQIDEPYYAKMDKIFCVSKIVRSGFCEVYPEYEGKTEVFQNILIPDDIKSKAQSGKGFDDGFEGTRLLTVARLHPQKALDISIEAFAKVLAAGHTDVRWYVLGEGAERPALEALIKKYNLEGKFILLGASPNPYPYFAQCDIYIQASHFEGWSISIAEALILQKPTIISDVAGSREQLENEETGLLIDLNADNVASAVIRLVENKSLREKFSQNLAKKNLDYARDVKKLYALAGIDA